MAMDMDEMLAKIKDRQWALADIDWDAPGAETIAEEFKPKLKAVHGRPVLDRERRRPRVRRDGEEGPDPDHRARSTATSTPRSSGTPTPSSR